MPIEPSHRKRIAVVLAAVAGVWAAAWLDGAPRTVPPERVVILPKPAVARAPSPFGDGPPEAGPDRSAAEERAVQRAFVPQDPSLDPAASRAAYREALERFNALRYGGGSPQELQAVARTLDAGLDERIERAEMSVTEALPLMAGLLDVLEPDPARRAAALARWREAQIARDATPPAPAR